MRNLICSFLFALYRLLCWSLVVIGMVPLAHAATPSSWNKGAYAYSAEKAPLSQVLQGFADSHGVELRLGELSDSEVNGKIRADSPVAFLDRLALEHHFQWFVYSNTLYVSPQDEQTSVSLEISPEAVPDLKQALTGIGLLDPHFGWGELPEEGVVLVTGPQEYVNLVSGFARKRESRQERHKVMNFPLRFAAVSDRTIHYRDQTLVIPGVATILNELMDGNRTPPVGATAADSGANATAGGEPATGYSNKALESESRNVLTRWATRTPLRSRAGKAALDGKVSADARNNALLIRDDEKRRPEYQQLIDSIDIPQNLVNIDAVILDVDRTALSRLEANWQGKLGSVTGGASLMSGSSTLFVSDFKRFFADIQALEGEGTASIVGNPSVLTLENQPAVVDFSRTAFITATGERVADIQPVTAGTSLQVTPRVIGKGDQSSIQLVIDIEDGQLETNAEGNAAGVKRGTVSTQALIGENRALVLGGFHVEESGDRDRRVPLLGDIPWVGKLFTSRRHEVSRRERLFILTPHLIGDQNDPTRYVSQDNRQQLQAVMGRVTQRNSKTDLYGMVENALRDLASGQTPAGFHADSAGSRLNEVCRSARGLAYESGRHQWYSNDAVTLAVGVVKNRGLQPLRFDEATCQGRRTLAVAAWPRTTLAPGQSTEVYLALLPARLAAPTRPSLIQP